MSVVDYAIQQVVEGAITDISPYILEIAFDNPQNHSYADIWGPVETSSTIEQGIREKVILKMICPVANVIGSQTEIIDLTGARIENLSGGIIAVNVPDFLTGGRVIVGVVEVYPGNINRAIANGNNFSGYATCGTSQMNNSLNRLINGLDNGNVQRTFTTFTITGRNSFIIRDAGSALFNMVAKVQLSYDEYFSGIPTKMYDKFAEWVEIATKAYIYRNCRRGMQEAISRAGVSVDDVQDEIMGYADAHRDFKAMYNDEMKKYFSYADNKGVSDTIKMMVPRKR